MAFRFSKKNSARLLEQGLGPESPQQGHGFESPQQDLGPEVSKRGEGRVIASILFVLLWLVVYAAVAAATVWLVVQNGEWPQGADTMCHVYKGDVLYRDILAGNFWPLYDEFWYNGVEMMRYWAPLPVYLLAGLQALAGGDCLNGYLLFVGSMCFLNALPWLYIGLKLRRSWLGAFVGLIWFFMPNNLFALFIEGNLPRTVCMCMLPLIVFWVWEYLKKRDWRILPKIAITFALAALCHSGYAGMIALGLLVFFVAYGFVNRAWARQLPALGAVLCGYALIGVWLVPSLVGGIASMDSSEVMATFFQDAFTSLNPLERYATNGVCWYFGLAAFILAVFGCICSKKESLPSFWTAVLIFLGTTTAAYPIMAALPGGQFLWMLRFISIALCMILLGLLAWETLRPALTVVFCALLVLDIVPSVQTLVIHDLSSVQPAERFEVLQCDTLIGAAKAETEQRLALLDGSSLTATGTYLVSDYDGGVATSFGAGYQSATTASNIVYLNRALDTGRYLYLFDRCLEMGDDTVLVSVSMMKSGTDDDIANLDEAAGRSGYELVQSNAAFRLYKLQDAPATWGTVTKYSVLGIGKDAHALALAFPLMDEADSTNLNDYTLEELTEYDTVYLADFTYADQESAEELIKQVSRAGTRVVINADGIPENPSTHDRIFCGVRCNTIVFSNGYPELETIDGRLNCDLFPQGFTTWQTVYLEGLDDCWGSVQEGGVDFDFYGTVDNDDLVMVGLNLEYHLSLTQDPVVAGLLAHAMEASSDELPEREIVPVSVSYGPNSIVVSASDDNVNTALAWHDIFSSEQPVEHRNNLVYVNAGTTLLSMSYPYFWAGLTVSVAALVALVALCVLVRWSRRTRGEVVVREADGTIVRRVVSDEE